MAIPMQRLKRRRDFVAVSKAWYHAAPGAMVQRRDRGDDRPPRVGFTATRKLGNAVARNRIRRRLKEAVRLALPCRLRTGSDYVVVGRAASLDRPFELLQADLVEAVERLNRRQRPVAAPDA